MRILYENTPVKRGKTAVALGFFDGVHLGHQAVILSACRQKGLKPTVYTFVKSPKVCLSGVERGVITTNSDKKRIMDSLGVRSFYCVDFNSIKNMTAQMFVSQILCKVLRAGQVFCGFNYRFGSEGRGDADFMKTECEKYGIGVTVVPPVFMDGTVVSSTEIRSALQEGDIRRVNKMLGRRYGYRGRIIHGRQMGRKLGTPTINQMLDKSLVLPKFGVYASLVYFEGKVYRGVTNIGVKPTVGSSCVLSETWMIEYSGDSLYGKTARVELLEFLRPEQKFSSLEELKKAILHDGMRAVSLAID